MSFIKNATRAVKKHPTAFLGITRGVSDIVEDMHAYRDGKVTASLLFYSISSAIQVVKNVKDIVDEVIDDDRIVIRIDPSDEIIQDILTGWSADEAKDRIYPTYQAVSREVDDGLGVALVPVSDDDQEIHLSNGGKAVLSVNKVPIIKKGKSSDSYTLSYNVYLNDEEDYKVFSDMLSEKLRTYSEPEDRPLRLFTNNMYGFNRRELPVREFDSVILKEGQSERISKYIQEFFDNKDMYTHKGFPHRTGLLLYGPPGTGKTSISTAIANKFKKNVYQIQLSSVGGDEELISLFSDIPPNSIVLLEDIDVATGKGKKREEIESTETGITLAALLNVIDGNFAPDDVITIMTTNDKSALDPALIRPGRVDLSIEVDYLDNDQLNRMCEYYLGYIPDGIPDDIYSMKVEPSKVISIFRENIRDTVKAGSELLKELQLKETIV